MIYCRPQSHMEQSIVQRHYSVVKITNSVFISTICIVVRSTFFKPAIFGQIFILQSSVNLKLLTSYYIKAFEIL